MCRDLESMIDALRGGRFGLDNRIVDTGVSYFRKPRPLAAR